MQSLDFSRLLFDEAATDGAFGASTNYFLVLFKVIIAIYLFVIAIRGKGKLVDNEFPKCEPGKYKLIMRLLCVFAGVAVLANGAVEFLGASPYGAALPLSEQGYKTLGTVLWAVGLVGLLAIIVVNIALTDRKAMEEARQKQEAERREASGTGGRRYAHSAAFEFDEEEINAGEFRKRRSEQENEDDNGGAE